MHPCDQPDKAGCEETCEKKGDEAVCGCPAEYQLSADGKSCEPGIYLFFYILELDIRWDIFYIKMLYTKGSNIINIIDITDLGLNRKLLGGGLNTPLITRPGSISCLASRSALD